MTKGKKRQPGKSRAMGTPQWAKEVIAIAENSKQGGIEIRFDAEPSPQLQPKLRAMSFRHSRMKSMWYGDNTQQARDFAEQVKAALPGNQDGPELFLEPSAEAVRSNLEKKEFSFVMISLKDGQNKSYVVFEPSKPKAEVIAGNFARQEFGDEFVSLAALPKTHIKEARTLFDEGKIIFPKGQQMQSERQESVMTDSGIAQSTTVTTDKLNMPTDKQNQLEREALDKFYKWSVKQDDKNMKPSQVTPEQLASWLNEHQPGLDERTIESIWQSHKRILKSLNSWQKRSGAKAVAQPYSSIYKKIMQVIPNLIEHIGAGKMHGKSRKDPKGGLMDLNYDYVAKDKDGNHIIALSHYFKQQGDMVADPDMQIRLLPEMEMAEALTFQDHFGFQQVYSEKDGKVYVNLKLKKSLNKFLNQWLTNIIHQGHKIDLSQEEEDEPESENYRKAWEQLTRLIPGLKTLPEQGLEGELILENIDYGKKRVIHCRIIPRLQGEYEVELSDTIDGDQQLESSLEFIPKNRTARVTAEWLSFAYADDLDRNEDAQEIEDRDGDVSEEMTRGLTQWLEEILDNHPEALMTLSRTDQVTAPEEGKPETPKLEQPATDKNISSKTFSLPDFDARAMASLIASQKYLANAWSISHSRSTLSKTSFSTEEMDVLRAFYTIYVLEDLETQKRYREEYSRLERGLNPAAACNNPAVAGSITIDLKYQDRHVPNVLVPAATQEPFYSQLWSLYDMKAVLKNNFPHLLEINSKNLSKASPIAMFELMQFAHPTDYGIKVNRMDMLNEWEKRGRSIFKAIGFPTDDLYPYVNLYLGYESVEPLKEMLFDNNKNGDEWWAIAEHSRPVADVKRGINIIDDKIAKEKREMKTYLNAATGKPKGEYKQQVKDVEYTIRNLEESKEVLQHYLDNEPKDNVEEEKIIQDPLANENGVFTYKTAGKNFEEIEIPIPKSAQYEATVNIVKTSSGQYTFGLNADKKFGDHNGMGFAASTAGQVYATREEALEVALKHHETRLEVLLTAKDSILANEAKKNKQLNTALDALRKFAEENAIALTDDATQAASTGSGAIIKGLEAAYWTKEDNAYPVNKITIKGMKFNQARLREAIGIKLEKLPIPTLEQIVGELAERFQERRSLAQYGKGLVTIGKKGDKRQALLIAAYVDDMIIDNDLNNKRKAPVMTFLLDLLFAESPHLADLPQHIETPTPSTKPMKKKNQYDLNKEIEAFIDEKDKSGSYYTEEERNYLRQYTGSGGLLKQGAADRGALYEYYTPDEVVKKMWDIAYHFGYSGGKVCEPSVGTGNFLRYAPENAIVFGFETNHYSARIAQILFPQAHIYEKAFETLFFAGNVHLKDKFENPGYNLIIGNPPYGEFTGKYAGMGEKQHTGATEYDQYFIVRGLDVLEPGGLLVLLIPSTFMTNGSKYQKVKEKIAAKAELLDCYRLPGRIFETTDIGTDILVLKRK